MCVCVCDCEGTSTANQPQWKLHLQDLESLELRVSTAEWGDTQKNQEKKKQQKSAESSPTVKKAA